MCGVKKSTCKHRTEVRAAGRKHHAVCFHLHGFSHNHHVTQEPFAGRTPGKTKVISELLVRQKATSVQPEKASRRPAVTDKAPELLPNPSRRSSNPSATSSYQCLHTNQSLNPSVLQPCLWFCFSQNKINRSGSQTIYAAQRMDGEGAPSTPQTSRAWRRHRKA